MIGMDWGQVDCRNMVPAHIHRPERCQIRELAFLRPDSPRATWVLPAQVQAGTPWVPCERQEERTK